MKKPRQDKKRIILGLTGSFGSGKTTVAGMFKSLGAYTVDADSLARGCLEPGSRVYKKVINAFGSKIILSDKRINRKELARLVFNNKALLRQLNAIMHPPVIKAIKDKIKSSRARVIVLDVPLLFEAGLKEDVDRIVVVKTGRKEQIERIRKRDLFTKADILKRIKSQIPLAHKLRLADFVIENNGTIQKTRKQVAAIWKSLAAAKDMRGRRGIKQPFKL